ncbi:hypothetical protein MUP77_26035 [Candidatus Bathyarchaeota archaeon]|nr:hypothetical protein [Candidatus Bathyarchaeota archaeon]
MSLQIVYGKDIIKKEINEISGITCIEKRTEISEMATKIAFDYLAQNVNSDPVTLARAAFFVALKTHDCASDENIRILMENNGKKNRWWLHLLPVLERSLK